MESVKRVDLTEELRLVQMVPHLCISYHMAAECSLSLTVLVGRCRGRD